MSKCGPDHRWGVLRIATKSGRRWPRRSTKYGLIPLLDPTLSLRFALLYPCTPVPLYPCTPVLLYPCTPVPLYPCTPVPMYPCPAVPMYPCTPVPLYPCAPVPLSCCTPVLLHPCTRTCTCICACRPSPLHHYRRTTSRRPRWNMVRPSGPAPGDATAAG